MHFDKAAEFFDAGDAAVVQLADFDRRAATTAGTATAKPIDLLNGARHRVAIVRIDEDVAGIVFGDVDLRTGCRSVMRRIVFPPGPMSRPIFSGSMWIVWMRGANLLSSARGAGSEASMTLRISIAGIAGLENRGLGDLERQPMNLQIELKAGDAFCRCRRA